MMMAPMMAKMKKSVHVRFMMNRLLSLSKKSLQSRKLISHPTNNLILRKRPMWQKEVSKREILTAEEMSSKLGESIAEEEASIVAEEASIVVQEVTIVETVESTEVAAADTTDASRMMPLREKKANLSTIRSPEVNREAEALTEVVAAATTSMREKQDLRVLKLNIRNIMKEPNMRVATEEDVVVVVVTEAITISPERKTHSIAISKERVKVVRAENLSDSLTIILPKDSHMVSNKLTPRNLNIPEDPGLTVRSRFHLTQ